MPTRLLLVAAPLGNLWRQLLPPQLQPAGDWVMAAESSSAREVGRGREAT